MCVKNYVITCNRHLKVMHYKCYALLKMNNKSISNKKDKQRLHTTNNRYVLSGSLLWVPFVKLISS